MAAAACLSFAGVEATGFTNHGHIESPIKGATSGNTEYLAFFTRKDNDGVADKHDNSEAEIDALPSSS